MEKFNLITNSTVELGDDLSTETNGKGRKFVSKFIEPGVAHYEQFGDVLIKKETLDKFKDTIIGAPVIIKHKDITDKNADKERVGVVSDVWYNEPDGYYYCSGIIWDKQAIDLVKNQGWSVSCTYDFESDKQPLTHNGKELSMEFTNGNFLHLALVDNPRYNEANIVMNSKVENEDKWITIKPNGEDSKGRHLLLKDGESPKEAIERTYGKKQAKDVSKEEYADIEKSVKKMSDDELVKAHFEAQKGYESETSKAGSLSKHEATYGIIAQELKKRTGRSFSPASSEKEIREALDKQPKGKLDVKKTTVKMKSGKEKEIEYVDKVPEGYEVLKGAMTAPLGYTWYTNGKSLLKGERHSILVKDKAENALLNGLDEIFDSYTATKEDLPILNGLKDILE